MSKLTPFTQTLTSPVYLVNAASSLNLPSPGYFLSSGTPPWNTIRHLRVLRGGERQRVVPAHPAWGVSALAGLASHSTFTLNIWLTPSAGQTDRSSPKMTRANDMTMLLSWLTASWRGKELLWNSAVAPLMRICKPLARLAMGPHLLIRTIENSSSF